MKGGIYFYKCFLNVSVENIFLINFEYLCPVSKGCSKLRAEIIPNEPEQVMLLREEQKKYLECTPDNIFCNKSINRNPKNNDPFYS